MESIGSPALWGGFVAFILMMLALDLGVLNRKAHVITTREAAIWSVIWISLALTFNAGVYMLFGPQKGLEFLTGYLIEKALSVDNIFVFLVIFAYFRVPAEYQHRVLFWGVLGALILRVIFILAGAALLNAFHAVIYVFGAFLIYTGIKLLLHKDEESDPAKSPIVKLARRVLPTVDEYHGDKFFIRKAGKLFATPLFLVLVAIEATDVVFAVDSIPAIFAVTPDPFIVFTSNIFAILGLRSLFFLLAGIVDKFRFLRVGLGLVLSFVGFKMLVSGVWKVPIGLSLGVIVVLLAGSIVASILIPEPEQDIVEEYAEDEVVHGSAE